MWQIFDLARLRVDLDRLLPRSPIPNSVSSYAAGVGELMFTMLYMHYLYLLQCVTYRFEYHRSTPIHSPLGVYPEVDNISAAINFTFSIRYVYSSG